MDEQFVSRLKSFAWRGLDAVIIFGLAWISENIGLLEFPIWVQGIIALGLGEITKYWQNRQRALGKTFFGGAL